MPILGLCDTRTTLTDWNQYSRVVRGVQHMICEERMREQSVSFKAEKRRL